MKLKNFESKYELVIVEWNDIFTNTGWNSSEEMHAVKPMLCVSVGFLLADEENQVVLCSGYAADEDMMDVTSIPKGTIIRMIYVGK